MDIIKRADQKHDFYHIFSRSPRGATLFHDTEDFQRFLAILFISNCSNHFIMRDLKPDEIFNTRRTGAIVDIAAYCILPGSYHIILREKENDGLLRFIRKIGTAYVMYYNRKYGHKGTVFDGTCRRRRVRNESQLYESLRRIHLYPFSAVNGCEKMIASQDMNKAIDHSSRYEYSSMRDYLGINRPQKAIIASSNAGRSRL